MAKRESCPRCGYGHFIEIPYERDVMCARPSCFALLQRNGWVWKSRALLPHGKAVG